MWAPLPSGWQLVVLCGGSGEGLCVVALLPFKAVLAQEQLGRQWVG